MFNSGEMFQSDELENRWFRVIEIFAERFLKNIGQKFWLLWSVFEIRVFGCIWNDLIISVLWAIESNMKKGTISEH